MNKVQKGTTKRDSISHPIGNPGKTPVLSTFDLAFPGLTSNSSNPSSDDRNGHRSQTLTLSRPPVGSIGTSTTTTDYLQEIIPSGFKSVTSAVEEAVRSRLKAVGSKTGY
ncbi:unnamed protein product [Protopolystoma xenopodis]|uniref:Uncharacterized protein n=1 Tax=Protopolystoma xenopodis TaxID=117903 RepID=A0A3S5AFC7_9PLAT|nr:unnamed protein product [Protopolystoma xenopodis]